MRNLNACTLDRRRAITGIFVALIVFASIFTVGFGYYIYQGRASLLSNQGALSRVGGAQGAEAESLNLTAGASPAGLTCVACVLEVGVSNSGGDTATITAIFVTTLSGTALSSSTNPSSFGSEFLTSGTQAAGDLNVTLPLSLAVGEGTSSLAGCGAGTGCAIGIRSTSCPACLTSGDVYINVLTSRGNIFSAEYCGPSTCAAVQTSTDTVTSATTSTSTSFSSTSTTTTLYGATSSTSTGGFEAGTNSLIVSMEACAGTTSPGQTYGTSCASPQPLAVYSSEEVILLVTVTSYANVALSVFVDYQAVGTNGATVTAQSSTTSPSGPPTGAESCTGGQTSPTMSIPADGGSPSSATFICTFIATQGPSGGTVTFLGYAVGTYASNSVTSAETLSNPIEIGNPASSIAGPFVGISFDYASEESTAFGSAVVVAATSSNQYVIWQATIENTANTSVTILEYSFLLVARIAQEHDFYIVQPVSSWTSDTLSSYTCAVGTANAPTGAQCSTAQTDCTTLGNGCVPTGDTTTLDFAASDISSTTWEWGSTCCSVSGSWNAPETVTMFVIVEYDFYNAGAWHVLAQAIPFTGTYFTG